MLRGVGVRVAVEVKGGNASIVWVEATSAVCTINVSMAFGSSGGIGVGVTKEGAHPTINDRAIKQVSSFILGDAMLPLVNRDIFYDSTISFTRPTAPLSRRTLIPCG